MTRAVSKEPEHDRNIEAIESEEADRDSSPPSYEILTYPADFTLQVLVDKLHKRAIKIPDFQRRFVWKQVQASKLIESFLLGLPVPPVFLYTVHKDGSLLVVDGQQRLRSVQFFFDGYFGDESDTARPPFRLVGLHERSRYVNKTYRDLEETDPEAFNRLNDAVLRSFVVKQLNPKDHTSIYHIFERLNTGGTFLQGQEIRNCIYPGPFNDLLHELNSFPVWRDIFGKKIRDKRQRDAELILRFFALLNNRKRYEKPMKEFLSKYMAANQDFPASERRAFKELFRNTAERVHDNLGTKPFHIRAGLNAAVYDSVFVAFASNPGKKPSHPKQSYERLLNDTGYIETVSSGTTDVETIHQRIRKAMEAFFGTGHS
jgi:hypothetical protein